MENVGVRIYYELLGVTVPFWIWLAGGDVFQQFTIRGLSTAKACAGELAAAKVFSSHWLEWGFDFLCQMFLSKFI